MGTPRAKEREKLPLMRETTAPYRSTRGEAKTRGRRSRHLLAYRKQDKKSPVQDKISRERSEMLPELI
jgi:hypothetical protein